MIFTLFPEAVTPYLEASILGRASQRGRIQTDVIPIRNFGLGKHRQVDDAPYGGGPGMVMRADVLSDALASVGTAAPGKRRVRIFLSPQGQTLDARLAEQLARDYDEWLLVCGHYEGVDERFVQAEVDLELSIGDFVLTGGELAALCVVDAVSRFLPGVVGEADSVSSDSFEYAGGLLKHAQYTRPPVWKGKAVPEVLLSGDHARIEAWRREEARARTLQKRPDLLSRTKRESKGEDS